MRLSTKGRFAVTAMIDIALREDSGPIPLSDIGVRHQISMSYLEQIFSKLRQHGLVQSTRGPGGGYALGQRAGNITVADIIQAVDEGATGQALGGQRHGAARAQQKTKVATKDKTKDMTQDLWDALNSRLVDYMQSITLRSLAQEQLAKGLQVEERQATHRGVFKKPPTEPLWASAPNSVFALGKLLART